MKKKFLLSIMLLTSLLLASCGKKASISENTSVIKVIDDDESNGNANPMDLIEIVIRAIPYAENLPMESFSNTYNAGILAESQINMIIGTISSKKADGSTKTIADFNSWDELEATVDAYIEVNPNGNSYEIFSSDPTKENQKFFLTPTKIKEYARNAYNNYEKIKLDEKHQTFTASNVVTKITKIDRLAKATSFNEGTSPGTANYIDELGESFSNLSIIKEESSPEKGIYTAVDNQNRRHRIITSKSDRIYDNFRQIEGGGNIVEVKDVFGKDVWGPTIVEYMEHPNRAMDQLTGVVYGIPESPDVTMIGAVGDRVLSFLKGVKYAFTGEKGAEGISLKVMSEEYKNTIGRTRKQQLLNYPIPIIRVGENQEGYEYGMDVAGKKIYVPKGAMDETYIALANVIWNKENTDGQIGEQISPDIFMQTIGAKNKTDFIRILKESHAIGELNFGTQGTYYKRDSILPNGKKVPSIHYCTGAFLDINGVRYTSSLNDVKIPCGFIVNKKGKTHELMLALGSRETKEQQYNQFFDAQLATSGKGMVRVGWASYDLGNGSFDYPVEYHGRGVIKNLPDINNISIEVSSDIWEQVTANETTYGDVNIGGEIFRTERGKIQQLFFKRDVPLAGFIKQN